MAVDFDTQARVAALVQERPDLIPLLRACVNRDKAADGQWWTDDDDDDATREGLRELVRRGLLLGVEPS